MPVRPILLPSTLVSMFRRVPLPDSGHNNRWLWNYGCSVAGLLIPMDALHRKVDVANPPHQAGS